MSAFSSSLLEFPWRFALGVSAVVVRALQSTRVAQRAVDSANRAPVVYLLLRGSAGPVTCRHGISQHVALNADNQLPSPPAAQDAPAYSRCSGAPAARR